MEDDFTPLVDSSWKAPLDFGPSNPLDSLLGKLKRLKVSVKGLERKKICERKQLLLDLNEEITHILLKDFRILSAIDVSRLKDLHDKKGNILAHEVTTQRLKSRVLWLKEGDANTKLFHAYASGRRNSNAIWSLKDINGNLVSDDIALKKMGKKHFSDVFMDDKSTNIADQLKVIRLFLTFTQAEEVNYFLEPITI